MNESAQQCIMQKSIDNPRKMEPQDMTFQASVSARSYAIILLKIVIMTRRLIIFGSKKIQDFLTS